MKLKSRKLWVWVTWAVYLFAALIITKQVDAQLSSFFFGISMTYLGVNVLQKKILNEK